QQPIRTPILGQLDRRAGEVALVLLELALEALEEGEGVRRPAGESGQHLILVEPAHLAGVGLHDRVSERHLSVAAERHPPVAANAEYRRAVDVHAASWLWLARVASRVVYPSGFSARGAHRQ